MKREDKIARAEALRDAIIDLVAAVATEFEEDNDLETRKDAYEIILNALGMASAGTIASMTEDRASQAFLFDALTDGIEGNLSLLVKNRGAANVEA